MVSESESKEILEGATEFIRELEKYLRSEGKTTG